VVARDLEQARIVVVAELARNYYEMRGAEQRLAVTQRTLQSLRDSLRVTEAQVGIGRGLAGDLARLARALASTEAQL
ncbi:TolC family protein, partial [Variovorax sp. CT11-76]